MRVEQSWCDRARGRRLHAGGSGISRRMLCFADFSLAFAPVNCRAWIVVRMAATPGAVWSDEGNGVTLADYQQPRRLGMFDNVLFRILIHRINA